MTIVKHGKSFGHEPNPNEPMIHNVFDDNISYFTEVYHRIRLVRGNPYVSKELQEKARLFKLTDTTDYNGPDRMTEEEQEKFLDELFSIDLGKLESGWWLSRMVLPLEEAHTKEVHWGVKDAKSD